MKRTTSPPAASAAYHWFHPRRVGYSGGELNRVRRRMLAKVAEATVVITNPTHYAVALAYDRGSQAAPRIVAKGMDDVAARIREAAARANVPLVANPPLARALHTLPLDAEVTAEHFKEVAEIIAYVWRLRGMAAGSPPN